jgi:UDP-N-acetylglucosamine diphosphorylase/glucosamine-1-phosphate N-acetyltransferase
VCRGALVEPGVVFDVRQGAVMLDQGVEVRHGTRLEGPLYAGPGARLLGGHLRASVFGPRTSIKGEVSTSVFTGYANKSHDGFVGHSVIGHWVNLGAGTTTSNLKNTYGEVSLTVGGTRIETGRQFLGSLIGDHAKTAIGTMLPTGTVVGAGANVFGAASIPKEIPPFAWGVESRERQTEEGFLRVAERVMPRRNVTVTPEIRASLSATYQRLAGG